MNVVEALQDVGRHFQRHRPRATGSQAAKGLADQFRHLGGGERSAGPGRHRRQDCLLVRDLVQQAKAALDAAGIDLAR